MNDRQDDMSVARTAGPSGVCASCCCGGAAWVSHLSALVVAGFFIYYAQAKILGMGPKQFVIDMGNYKILPREWVNIFAILMPWWEVGAAIALVIPRTRRAGAILIAGMLLLFIGAVAVALYRGLDISCGCAGTHSSKAGWWTIGRNVLLLTGTGLAACCAPRKSVQRGFPVD